MFDVKIITIAIIAGLFLVVLQKTWQKRWFEFMGATLIALVWSLYYPYEYVGENLYVLGVNMYPFVLWTAGLVTVVLVYDSLKQKNEWSRFFIIVCLYWVLLILVESIWYWWFGVRLTSHYEGLWGFDVLHGPTTLKTFYLLAGPLFLGTILFIRKKVPMSFGKKITTKK